MDRWTAAFRRLFQNDASGSHVFTGKTLRFTDYLEGKNLRLDLLDFKCLIFNFISITFSQPSDLHPTAHLFSCSRGLQYGSLVQF
jgi:hypothetical protein